MVMDRADERPIRLLVSGGGMRALFGGMGVITALVVAGDWPRVREVVSVSGGSFVTGALVAHGDPMVGGASADIAALGSLFDRVVEDRVTAWASLRRLLWLIATVAWVAAVVLLVVRVAGSVPPVVAVLITVVVGIPLAVQVGRRLLGRAYADVVDRFVAAGAAPLASFHTPGAHRRYVICASGLRTSAPYYFEVGRDGDAPPGRWGVHVDAAAAPALRDVVLASTSLPLIDRVRSPRADGCPVVPEPLVDGGASGVFGQQLRDPWGGGAAGTSGSAGAAGVEVIAVDGMRHEVDRPGLTARFGAWVSTHVSITALLVRWLKVGSEALYVNDLMDLDGVTTVRLCAADLPRRSTRDPLVKEWEAAFDDLCAARSRHAEMSGDGDIAAGLRTLRERATRLGLFGLSRDRAVDVVTLGFVATWVARTDAATRDSGRLEQDLGRAGSLLLGDAHAGDLLECWTTAVRS
jgi:hypothetical protein